MNKSILAAAALGALALAACGGGGGSSGGTTYGGGSTTPTTPATLAPVSATTIGIGLPSGLGTETDPTWGTVGGFTEANYSQVLAFPVGTTVTIANLGTTTAHTLNVISASSGAPANFPANPTLSTAAAGGSTLAAGYASGPIAAGGSVSVTLANAGMYLIGCAYHYASNQMRDVLIVSNTATPGPQATPPATGTGGPSCGAYC